MKTSAQAWTRPGKRTRWAYVLTDDDGHVVYVSSHRFGSEGTALDAAEFDVASLKEWEDDNTE